MGKVEAEALPESCPGGRSARGAVLAPRPVGSGRAQASAPLSPVPLEGEDGARADVPGRAGGVALTTRCGLHLLCSPRAHEARLYRAAGRCLLLIVSLSFSGDRRPWKALSGGWPLRSQAAAGPTLPFPPGPCGVSAVSAVDLRESSGPPLAPPSKRHCRSLSEPDELARCRSPWRPGGSKIWTAVSKRRCHSGGSTSLPGSTLPATGPSSPPAPRPASASGSCVDGGRGSGPPWGLPGPTLSSRRRLSLSQEHLLDADTPSSAPALGWRLGLLRSRSQPCVLVGRKSRLKRPREEDPRWPRPSLDFLKMTRVRLPVRGPPCRTLLPQQPWGVGWPSAARVRCLCPRGRHCPVLCVLGGWDRAPAAAPHPHQLPTLLQERGPGCPVGCKDLGVRSVSQCLRWRGSTRAPPLLGAQMRGLPLAVATAGQAVLLGEAAGFRRPQEHLVQAPPEGCV